MSMPHRCLTCSSTSCCVTWAPYEIEPPIFISSGYAARMKKKYRDPNSILFWTLATRARARVTHAREGDY